MPRRATHIQFRGLIFVAALLCSAMSLRAATVYWDIDGATAGAGGATPSGTWDAGATTNWTTDSTGASAPTTFTNADDAVFSAGTDATGTFTVTLGGSLTANSLNFEEGTVTIDGTGGPYTLTLGGTGNTTVASGSTSTLNTIVGGTGGLTKLGAGTLVLNQDNAYTGGTSIDAGTLLINAANNITGTGTITLNGGTLSHSTDDPVITNAINVTASSTLANVTAGHDIEFSSNSITGTASTVLSITDAGAGTNSVTFSGSGFTYNGDIDLDGGSRLVFTNTSGTQTFAGAITGTGEVGGLDRNGAGGTTVFSGNNSFTTGVNVTAGVLNIRHANALGSTAAGTTVSSGAALEIQGGITTAAEALTLNGTGVSSNGALRNVSGSNTYAGAITLGSDSSIGVTGGNLSLSGEISGAYKLTKSGGSSLYLINTSNNTYSGGTDINGGEIRISEYQALGTGTVTLNGGGIKNFDNNPTLSNAIVLTGTDAYFTAGWSKNVTLSGVISGTGNLNINTDSGEVILSNTNTFTGNINIGTNGTAYYSGTNHAELTVSSDTNLGNAANDITFATGEHGVLHTTATFTLGSGRDVTLSGNSDTFETNAARTLTYNGVISGAGGLVKDGDGTLILGGTNTNTGTITVNNGILQATTAAAIQNDVTVNSGGTYDLNALNFGSTRDFTIAGTGEGGVGALINTGGGEGNVKNITLSANATVGVTGSKINVRGTSLDGGGFTLTKIGTGEFNIRTDDALDNLAGITVSAGTLRLESSQSPTTAFDITVDSGATLDSWANFGSRTYGANLGVNLNGGTLQANGVGDATWNGDFTLSATSTVSGSEAIAITGDISGAGGLTKAGTNTLTLSGTNTYTGTTTINAGTILLSGGAAIADTGAVVLADVATAVLDVNDTNETIGSLSGGGGTGGNVMLGSGTLTTGGDNSSTTYAGVISETGGLTKAGTGTFTLTGTNTYTGQTAINGGTLSIAADANLGAAPGSPTAGHLDFDNGTLNTTATFTLSANRGIDLQTNGGTINTDTATTLTYDGIAAGTGALTKAGDGTLVLGGTNTYAGQTALNAGTLEISADANLGAAPGSPTAGHLDLNGGLLHTTATFTLNTNRGIDLQADSTIETDASTTLTYGGIAAGTGALTKEGDGQITLTGTNTYTGITTVNNGTVLVNAGGDLNGTDQLFIGSGVSDSGTVTISGAGSTLATGTTTADAIQIGVNGDGTLNVLSGADVSVTGQVHIGRNTGATGHLEITGSTFSVQTNGDPDIQIGSGGYGTALINGGSTVLVGDDFIVADELGGDGGSATISGTGTTVTTNGVGASNDADVMVGLNATGDLTVDDSAVLTSLVNIRTGVNATGIGTLTVSNSAAIIAGNNITAGEIAGSDGTINLTSSATADAIQMIIGDAGIGVANINTSADVTLTGDLLVGNSAGGDGTINLLSGADITSDGFAVGNLGTGVMTISGAGTTLVTSSIDDDQFAIGQGATGDGTLTVNSGATVTSGSQVRVGNAAGSVGVLNIDGSGTTFTVDNGANDRDLEVGTAGTGTLTVSNNAVVTMADQLIAGRDATGNGTITIQSGADVTAGHLLNGSWTANGIGDVTVTGSGSTLTLNNGGSGIGRADGTGTGLLTVDDSGIVTFNGAATVGATGTLALTNDGIVNGSGTITHNTGGVIQGDGSISNNIALAGGTFNGTTGQELTASGVLSGTGALTKNGVGTMTTSGTSANTYSGATTINDGMLILQKTAGLNAITGNVTVGDGSGTDVLRLGASNQIADTAVVTINGPSGGNSGKFELNGFDETVAGITDSSAPAAVIQVEENGTGKSSTLTINNSADHTFNGIIRNNSGGSSTLTIVKEGTGKLTLGAATVQDNSYSGTTTINAGVINIQDAQALGSTAAGTTVASGAALELQGGLSYDAEGLTLNGTGVSSAGALRNISGNNTWTGAITLASHSSINVDADTLTASGVISSTGNLTKGGAGTLTLSGTNTYSGTTTISAGTLNVTGSISTGTTTVNGGGTLAGTGTINGDTTIQGTGILSPGGTSAGTLTFGSGADLTLNNTSVYRWDLAAGPVGDLIDAIDNLFLNTAWTLDVRDAGGIDGIDDNINEYDLFHFNGTLYEGGVEVALGTDLLLTTFNIDDSNLTMSQQGKFGSAEVRYVYTSSGSGGRVYLTEVIPLPGPAALVVIGLGLIAARRPTRNKPMRV